MNKQLPFYQRFKLFQKTVIVISCSFGVSMFIITVIAFTRSSHSTHQDVEQMQKQRKQAILTTFSLKK